jgi:hypothetical protein
MNEHGAMCVEVEADNATRQVVDYESDDLERTLASLPEGTSLPLEMERLSDRGNVWRALAIRRGHATSPTPSAP